MVAGEVQGRAEKEGVIGRNAIIGLDVLPMSQYRRFDVSGMRLIDFDTSRYIPDRVRSCQPHHQAP